MANPLAQQILGQMMGGQQSGGMPFQNPVQKFQYILQAMTNPAAFVRQQFPDVPEDIQNDPNKVFEYLQRTRGQVSQNQIQQAQQMADQIKGQGTVR